VCITHPFHPLSGHEFDLVSRRRHWGEDQVVYRELDGTLRTVAAALTDIDAPDAFRRIAAGSAAFRTVDLQILCAILDRLLELMDTDGS
jgi:hypothetical protein